MQLQFYGDLWCWRGPAPWYFVTVPDEQCRALEAVSGLVSYGWGMIPVTVTIGTTTWKTSLFPKDGRYVVPVKAQVRRREDLDEGETISVSVAVDT